MAWCSVKAQGQLYLLPYILTFKFLTVCPTSGVFLPDSSASISRNILTQTEGSTEPLVSQWTNWLTNCGQVFGVKVRGSSRLVDSPSADVLGVFCSENRIIHTVL